MRRGGASIPENLILHKDRTSSTNGMGASPSAGLVLRFFIVLVSKD
jgi:hypothetical protein